MSEQMPLQNITIGQMLRQSARRFPERPALEYGDRIWCYREYDEQVDIVARRLLTLGVQKGDHVGIWCEVEPNAIFLIYALARIGAIVVMLNTSLQKQEMKGLLKKTDVRFLAIGDGYKELNYPLLCQGITMDLPAMEKVFYIGRSHYPEGYECLPEQLASQEMLQAAEYMVQSQDTSFILFTSGTTSAPKAVMTSHFSRVNNAIQQVADLEATEHDRFCAAMPIFHCFCLTVNVLGTCAVGACLVLPIARKTETLLGVISQKKCTVMSSVPTLYHAMLCREDFDSWDLSSLRTGYIGGSIYSPKLFKEIEERFRMTLISSLGQTEATGGLTSVHLSDPLDVRASTVGQFIANSEGKIVDVQTGKQQPCGKEGEICVKGYLVMQGYYKQPDETAKTVSRDGWLHTGDVGYQDENGYVHITGRLKEMIIRGGENITPGEIERILLSEPRVSAAKVIGVPDPHYIEVVCACIVPSAPISEEEVRDLVKGTLADFKVPKYVLFFESFPQTATGKINGNAIKKQAMARIFPEKCVE